MSLIFVLFCCHSNHNIWTPVVSHFNCYPQAKESVLQDYLAIPLNCLIDGPGIVVSIKISINGIKCTFVSDANNLLSESAKPNQICVFGLLSESSQQLKERNKHNPFCITDENSCIKKP